MDQKYIVVVGSMNCDVIFLQERLPLLGETFLAKSATVASGGKGANQAVQAAKLGAKTYMVAKVGNDNFGAFLSDTLAGYGVDTTYIMKSNAMTGIAAVNTLPDGVYHSTVAPGSNMEITVSDVLGLEKLIAGAAAVILQMEIPMEVNERIIRVASEAGVYIVLNAAPAAPIPEETLKLVDCLIVNESEASYYLGVTINSLESARKSYPGLLSRVKTTLIITLGAGGSLLCTRQGSIHFPVQQTVSAVDTTGSGDSYIGAFTFLKTKGAADREACAFASLVSQYTVSQVGGQVSMPSMKEAAAFLKTV